MVISYSISYRPVILYSYLTCGLSLQAILHDRNLNIVYLSRLSPDGILMAVGTSPGVPMF